jgi:hypothetical protein
MRLALTHEIKAAQGLAKRRVVDVPTSIQPNAKRTLVRRRSAQLKFGNERWSFRPHGCPCALIRPPTSCSTSLTLAKHGRFRRQALSCTSMAMAAALVSA